MTFAQAVRATPELEGAWQPGLRALGAKSAKVTLRNGSLCGGSVDIDAHLQARYPDKPRWDYAFGYAKTAHFVEVHPARTSEVDAVLAKYAWLRGWLLGKAPDLQSLPKEFHWVATNGISILKSSPQSRLLARNGLVPIRHLPL